MYDPELELDKKTEALARRIAQEIRALRNGLDVEERNLKDHPTYVRAKKYRDQDRAQIRGMRVALSFVLNRGMGMQLAEAFIAESDDWRAML